MTESVMQQFWTSIEPLRRRAAESTAVLLIDDSLDHQSTDSTLEPKKDLGPATLDHYRYSHNQWFSSSHRQHGSRGSR